MFTALRSSSSASGRRHTGIATPLTPQTEAARILARIGDEVRDQYGNQITAAVNEVMLHQLQELTYTKFKEISKAVIDENLPGWRQVLYLSGYKKGVCPSRLTPDIKTSHVILL